MTSRKENGGQDIYHKNIRSAHEEARRSDVVLVDIPYAGALAGPVTRLIAANRIDVPVAGVEFAGQAWLDFLNSKGFAQSKIEELFTNPTLTDSLREEYRKWLVVKAKSANVEDNTLGGRLLKVGELINTVPHKHIPRVIGITALPLADRNVADDLLQVATQGRMLEFTNQHLLSGDIVVGGVKAATVFDYSTKTSQERRAIQRQFQRGLLAGA